MARRNNDFQTIHSEGGLLPPDLLRRVLDPKEKLDGTRPEDYGLPPGERLTETVTQSWNRLRKHWAEFSSAKTGLPAGEAGTGLTNEKWSLPLLRELGFGLLPASAGPEIGGRTYAINRFVGPVPLHLVGCGLSLDRRAKGVRGAAAANPHGLAQEFLNRSDDHLWAIVSNGLRLRVLRDSQALSRQSFLEFDVEAMLDGEVYSDFVLLWLMAHATRFAPREAERPETCWLEQWTTEAEEQGTRALGDLRGGVERALQILGEGFTGHAKNTVLRDSLRSGQLGLTDFHGQLLRVVYRLIFLFVAEDRTIDGQPLLHPHDDSDAAQGARERFGAYYGTARLREMAGKIKGSRHRDLWRQFQLLVGALSGDKDFAAGREELALPALGSFLWSPASTAALNDADLANYDFLEALRHLAFTRQGKVLRPVDYRNLGAEELGGVYESLLALTPQISADGARFTFAEFAESERKTSGSYYTPDSLVQCLLDSTLDPLVEEAIRGKSGVEAQEALLALRVCDPAVGSGHFLVGAAHRLARHLARVRALAEGESEPSPILYQQALRDVIGRCLYGVDVNPMAAELCRVGLWLEALEPGKPLSFLDHHIRVGNSLLGATPELIAHGLPDGAFKPIEGDDKNACASLKKRNKAERKGLGSLFARQDAETQARLVEAAAKLEELPDDRPEDIRAKELAFCRHEQTKEYQQKKRLADSWCAAFVVNKHFREPGREASVSGITQGYLNELVAGRALPEDLAAQAERLSEQYQFFHWHLAFPEVFAQGGFDGMLGNPPWEVLKAEQKATEEQIRLRRCSARFTKASGRFPLGSHGKANTMPLFLELFSQTIRPKGRAGLIVKTVIATERDYRVLFTNLVESRHLISLFDFENSLPFFEDVHRQERFSLITIAGTPTSSDALFGICLRHVDHLRDDTRTRRFSADALRLLGGGVCSLPSAEGVRDVAVLHALNRHTGRLFDDNWNGRFFKMLDTTEVSNDPEAMTVSDLRAAEWERADAVPVYEGKFFAAFDHRAAEAQDGKIKACPESAKSAPSFRNSTHYYLPRNKVSEKLLKYGWTNPWVVVYGRKVNRNNVRTMSAAVIPLAGAVDTCPTVLFSGENIPLKSSIAVALLNSFAFDYLIRSRLSGFTIGANHLASMAVPGFSTMLRHPLTPLINAVVLELSYTAWDLKPFAEDCGWTGPPFRWDEERRFVLRSELDAALFHLYLPTEENGDWRLLKGEMLDGLAALKASFPNPRNVVTYVMDTFAIVRRRDEEKYNGDYRTKRVTLEVYDAMQESMRIGEPYQPRVDPPPADPSCCHPAKAIRQTEQ